MIAALPFATQSASHSLCDADSPLGTRIAIQSLFLARVLSRRQQLFESTRRRLAERAYGVPVAHASLPASTFVELPRIPFVDCTASVLEAVLASSVPTVLEGAAAGSVATERWTPRHLAERYGDASIPMFPEHSPSVTLSLRECVAHIEAGGQENIQVNNVCSLLTDPEGLIRELPLDRLRSRVPSVRYHGANLLVAGPDNGSKYHCANELNFFFQVLGEKEWFFVHPRFTPWMNPHFTVPRCTYFGSGLAWGEQPQGVPIGHVILKPGDVLVNPPWWWHWVVNRTTTIGVATRWYAWRHRFGTDNPFFSFLQWLFPHQWRLMWTDCIRGGKLDDKKWVHREAALGEDHP